MKKLLVIFFAFAAVTLGLQAQSHAPAYRGVIPRVQPNGDTLHVFLRGDEHWHFMMTVDGWQVKENNKGKIYYAKYKTKKVNGEKQQVVVSSSRTAHDADKRSKCEKRWLQKHGIQKLKNE